jgi:hypothetical protein
VLCPEDQLSTALCHLVHNASLSTSTNAPQAKACKCDSAVTKEADTLAGGSKVSVQAVGECTAHESH